MHVFHTEGAPPKRGRMYLPMINCTSKRRKALRRTVAAKANGATRAALLPSAGGPACPDDPSSARSGCSIIGWFLQVDSPPTLFFVGTRTCPIMGAPALLTLDIRSV